MWRCSEELRNRVLQLENNNKKEAKHYCGVIASQVFCHTFLMGRLLFFKLIMKFTCFLSIAVKQLQDFTFSLAPLCACQRGLKLKCHGCNAEFWKTVPATEPFRTVLGDIRDRLYQTQERLRQLMASGKSEIPVEETFTNKSQVLIHKVEIVEYPVHVAILGRQLKGLVHFLHVAILLIDMLSSCY